MSDETPIHDLLTRRDVDDIKQVSRALQSTMAVAEVQRARDARATLAMLERLCIATEALMASNREVASNTSNLPALMDLMVTKRTNGHGHHEESRDERRSDDS